MSFLRATNSVDAVLIQAQVEYLHLMWKHSVDTWQQEWRVRKHVYSPPGQKLRCRLINSKFPAPLTSQKCLKFNSIYISCPCRVDMQREPTLYRHERSEKSKRYILMWCHFSSKLSTMNPFLRRTSRLFQRVESFREEELDNNWPVRLSPKRFIIVYCELLTGSVYPW